MKFKFSRLRRAAACAFACCITTAFADTATVDVRTISWLAPDANDDGSVLDNLLGYYVYIGDSPGTMVPYTFTPSLTQSWELQYVPNGVHYLAVTAVNVDGVESEMSSIVTL